MAIKSAKAQKRMGTMAKTTRVLVALTVAALFVVGCDNANQLTGPADSDTGEPDLNLLLDEPIPARYYPAPGPIVTVMMGSTPLDFWPYTGENFSGSPQDPINVIFFGKADPRDIRAALLALDGDRTALGFPADPPFNATWDDAIGNVQTGYGSTEGWTGGAIQLACGGYGPLRFHLRLFRMGEWTVGNAHFELLIPGTTNHQVLSWEVAEQFVIADFLRSGLLDADVPLLPSGLINQPNFREIPAQVYNLLPPEVQGLIGGPIGTVVADVPIGSDGVATILNLAGSVPWTPEERSQDMTIVFDQTVPMPFCSDGPYDYVYVTGNVELRQTTTLSEDGRFQSSFHAHGSLNVLPVNPLTGEPAGETMSAMVREYHSARLDDRQVHAASWVFQQLHPMSNPDAGRIFRRLIVGQPGITAFKELETCAAPALVSIH
jgi:hypothetical protein